MQPERPKPGVRERDVAAQVTEVGRLSAQSAAIVPELQLLHQPPEPGSRRRSIRDLEDGVARRGFAAVAAQDQPLNVFELE